jgi:hypothetical protein
MIKEICTCAIGGHLIIMRLKLTKEKGRGKMGVCIEHHYSSKYNEIVTLFKIIIKK